MQRKSVEKTPDLHAVKSPVRFGFRNRYVNALSTDGEHPPDSFEKQIRRNPNDLNAHCLRIRHYQREHDGPGCFAALVDLFIVLGTRGTDLRKRLIDQSAFLLPKHFRDFLENHMKTGISSRTPLPYVHMSILTDAISGTTELFTTESS